MSCTVKISKRPNVTIIEVKGELAGQDSNKLSNKVTEILTHEKGAIALDLSQTDYVDSPGLGIFIFAWKQARDQAREVVILNPSEFVRETLERTNLDQQFRIIKAIEEL